MSFSNDFLNGQYDEYFKVLNQYSETTNDYTAYKTHLLSQNDYSQISSSVAQMPFIISCWQSNIGANGRTVIVSTSDKLTDRTRQLKEKLKSKVYDILYTKHNWKKLELQIIKLLAKEGNAVVLLNADGLAIVESIFRFDVYFDNQNKTSRYAYKKDGGQVAGMSNLKHGVDLYHIKDPVFSEYAVAPSRIDAAFGYLMLEQKAVKLNTHMFANGNFSNILLQLDSTNLPRLNDTKKEENGLSWAQNWIASINDKIKGVSKAGRLSYIPGLKGIFELGKTNKESQFMELIKDLTPERLAWAYSMTLTDFGAGGSTTFNNVSTFDDALYDKLGRPLEMELDKIANEWLLPLEGVAISSLVYVQYESPEDPNKLLEVKEWREDYKVNVITVNEYREKRGLPALPDGDVPMAKFLSGMVPAPALPDPNITDVQSTETQDKLESNQSFFGKAGEPKTLTERAESSDIGLKFKARWLKALTSQAKDFVNKFSKLSDSDLEGYEAKLDKIETYYAFNVLKKDLLGFAGFAIDNLKKDKRLKFSVNYFDGEYPKEVLDAITNRTEMVLKGLGDYAGVDAETTLQINNLISLNASKGVAVLTGMLQDLVPELSKNRAEVIATTEVSNAAMGTEFTMYQKGGATSKKLYTVQDERVRVTHREAQSKGWVAFDFAYSGGFQRGGEQIRCRCGMEYGFENEHKE